jgi:hypothetical protein
LNAVLSRWRGIPTIFSWVAVGGIVGGCLALIYACSGRLIGAMHPVLLQSSWPRVWLGAVPAMLCLLVSWAILVRHRLGLFIYLAWIGYLFGLVPLYAVWRTGWPAFGFLWPYAVAVVVMCVYGVLNRRWFRP